jgi:two-component system LytT family sensor kinase
MNRKRIFWHILFWLIQYSISLYNELYMSVSFTRHPTLHMFLESAFVIFLILIIKITVVYYMLYRLIPRWIKAPSGIALYAEALGIVLFAALCVRLLIQLFVWPVIYKETASLGGLQLTARYFYTLMDLLQVVGLASAIKLFKLRISAAQNEKMLVQEKLRSEMLHLKSQVNPHFLFNTLNSIYSLSRAQSAQAPDAIMRLSKILRYMLYEAGQKTISLQEELKVMDDYIELQQLRFGQRLKIEVARQLDEPTTGIAPLLLLPLVENAFKHGSNEGGIISISVLLNKNKLTFSISNPVTQTGFQPKEEGIGLANIRRQLELLYPEHSLETSPGGNIFNVTLKIDLSQYAGFELFDSRG